jgi:carotenoid cleavage dioxygenase-like enzyme
MRNHLLAAFIPWIFFSVFYGSTPDSIFFASVAALILVLILNFKELRQGFVLPCGSAIFFAFLAVNDRWNCFPWIADHALLFINSALAAIVYFSMLIGKPFSMQYAWEKVDPAYWRSPAFIKINWLITSVWAFFMTLMALPSWFIPQAQLLDSWFWNYGVSIICIVLALSITKKIPNFYFGQQFWHKVKKLPPVDSPYLKGGYAPVKDEVTLDELKIEGVLPLALKGTYLRNGPNPLFAPYTYTYPIDGDGMIHSVTLAHGWASYKNRFVKTKGLLAEKKAGRALYGGVKLPLVPDPKYVTDCPIKDTASIHVAPFGKHLLALYESMPAYQLDKDLNTLGEWQPDGQKNFNVNAHHRRDSKTGHIYACTYATDRAPFLTFYEFDQDANLLKTISIEKAHPTMIHDFALTEHYLIVFDTPAIFNLQNGLTYHKEQPLIVMLIDRNTFAVKKISVESFFVYHFVNAYEEDNKVIVDFVHHETLNLDPLLHKSKRGPKLYRAEINILQETYQHDCLCEISLEFPTYALAHTGQNYRYGYFCAKSNEQLENFDSILKYDFVEQSYQFFKFSRKVEVDEAIFVPTPNGKGEDEGYLMLFVYYPESGVSDFALLDAQRPGATKPMALIKLGRRVPHGLHGSWITD